jgi:hypothetical protein
MWNVRDMETVTYFMLWRLQVCCVNRPNDGKVTYFMLWTPQICSAQRPNYWKRIIFHGLETADMLCEAPELWKTYHISCFGDCRYALWNARTIENVTYFMLWMPQMCSVKRPNYGKRIIFYAVDHQNITKHDKTTQPVCGPLVLLEPGTFAQEHIGLLSYFLVPNHSLHNTHKNVRPVFGRWLPYKFHVDR